MQERRLVTGLTVAFAAMSLALAIVGVLSSPAVLVLAAVFAGVAGIFWYQASGRLARRVYRRVEQQATVDDRTDGGARGGFGAGPREEWRGPHRRRGRAAGAGSARGRERTRTGRAPSGNGDLTAREAYEVLGLDPGANEDAIRRAYRERIKQVHPDTEGGDEDAFRRVRTAYERLSD